MMDLQFTPMMNQKMGFHPSLNHSTMSGRYSPPYRPPDPVRRMPNHTSSLFGGLDDSLLARAEALSAVDISKNSSPPLVKQDTGYGHDMQTPTSRHHPQMALPCYTGEYANQIMDQMSMNSMQMSMSMDQMHQMQSHHTNHPMYPPAYPQHPMNTQVPGLTHHSLHPMHDQDCDPRELEAFAERFKQRRIKLGVTQCDVGSALGNLKLPGVGSLSQSTICRFESLTLSHNNMIALKPVLQAWLEEAERQAREKKQNPDIFPNCNEKKRKRTSIAAPEKRSLEAYFAVQPRPSGEKIAQIAEKLDLKKNVVRVWFCNQRQKQKRMKFSANQLH